MDRLQVLCFAGTYALALASDLARVVVRAPLRWYATLTLTAIGFAVHTAFLLHRLVVGNALQAPTVFESFLLVAWLVAATTLYLSVRASRKTAVGIFLLPIVLGLAGAAAFAPRASWADWGGWAAFWGTVHGLFLLVGAAASAVAFAAGLMYLLQARRLKLKQPIRFGFVLPSLEQSERLNRGGVAVAFPTLTIGLVIGVILGWAMRANDRATISWTDPKVLSGLAMWLVFAVLAHAQFRWAMRGRRVMILSIVAFGFLIFALVGVDLLLPTAHGVPGHEDPARAATSRLTSPDDLSDTIEFTSKTLTLPSPLRSLPIPDLGMMSPFPSANPRPSPAFPTKPGRSAS